MSIPSRANIKIGSKVNIIQKEDQGSGCLTQGKVERLLTKSPSHPHGIKVRLDTGEVGRVQSFDNE
ncbi:YwbE family protein [Marinomonas sp. 2405UD68-3]|uniref:YwbE family protein n=1 Tax=Marinomonas sp. 2405UD68-3 TaxID=3391835 RepID=UPI0039C9ACB0